MIAITNKSVKPLHLEKLQIMQNTMNLMFLVTLIFYD